MICKLLILHIVREAEPASIPVASVFHLFNKSDCLLRRFRRGKNGTTRIELVKASVLHIVALARQEIAIQAHIVAIRTE